MIPSKRMKGIKITYGRTLMAQGSVLEQSLQGQEYVKGQLNGLGTAMEALGKKSTDPAVTQLAGSVVRMAENIRPTSPTTIIPDLHLRVQYEGADLQGRPIMALGPPPMPTIK